MAEKARKAEAKRQKEELAAKKRADKAASQSAARDAASAASRASGGPGHNSRASSSKEQPVVVDLEPHNKAKKTSKKKKANKSPPQEKVVSQGSSSSSEEEEDSEETEAVASEAEEEEPKKKKKSKKRKKDAGSDSDSDMKAFFKGFAKMAKKSKKSKKKKRSRSSSSDSSASDEDEVVLFDKKLHVKDNGVDVVNMELRHCLRTPSSEPATWWRPPFKSKVSRPIRGAGLSMEAAMGPARVNDATIRRAHDRASCLTTRMLLTRNADVSIKDCKTLKVEGNTISSDRKWSPPEEAWEIAEAVQNYVTLTYYIRNYSFEGLAIQRCFHDFGYFLGKFWSLLWKIEFSLNVVFSPGCVSSEKEQRDLLELAFDKLLARNAQRAKVGIGGHPLTYEEVRAAIRTFLNSKGKAETGLYGVDPYAGRKRITEAAKIKETVISELRQMGWRGPEGHGHGHDVKPKKKKEKTKKTGDERSKNICVDYNSQAGCSASPCAKQHKCNKREGDFVCGRSGHNKFNCDHPKFAK